MFVGQFDSSSSWTRADSESVTRKTCYITCSLAALLYFFFFLNLLPVITNVQQVNLLLLRRTDTYFVMRTEKACINSQPGGSESWATGIKPVTVMATLQHPTCVIMRTFRISNNSKVTESITLYIKRSPTYQTKKKHFQGGWGLSIAFLLILSFILVTPLHITLIDD